MARRNVNKRIEENDSPDAQPRSGEARRSPNRRPRHKRLRLWLLIAVVGAIAIVFTAPIIIAKTSLKQSALNWALQDFDGQLVIESASLNWFSPIELKNVTATDSAGDLLFEIESIATSRPLLSFLYSSDLGKLTIAGPTLHAQLRPDGSNFEDAFAKMLADDESTANSTELPNFELIVTGGQVLLDSANSDQPWQIDKLELTVISSDTNDAPLQADLQCEFVHEGKAYGGLAIASTIDTGSNQLEFQNIDSSIIAKNVPLALMKPLFARLLGPSSSDGYLSGEMEASIATTSGETSLKIKKLELDRAAFSSESLLGKDQVSVNRLTANGSLLFSPTQITAKKFQIESELGNTHIDGQLNLQQLVDALTTGTLPSTPFQIDGRFDLARVANMLPNTLLLHQNLKVESGLLQFQASTRMDGGVPRLVFNLDTANVQATRSGQPIIWQKPLRLAGAFAQTTEGLLIENVRCSSDFLTIKGTGSLENGELEFTGDLGALIAKAGQFVDFGELKLGGQFQGTLGWKTNQQSNSATKPRDLKGQLELTNPVIQWPGTPPWAPEQLTVGVDAQVTPIPGGSLTVSRASVGLGIGDDRIWAILNEPIGDLWNADRWQARCRVQGDAHRWLALLQNFAPLGDINAAGELNLECLATIESNLLRINKLKYEVADFGFAGYTMDIREHNLSGNGNINVALDSGLVSISNLSAKTPSLTVNTKDFVIRSNPVLDLEGTLFFQADVNGIARWWHLSGATDSIQWLGQADGKLGIDSAEDGRLHIQLRSNINKFAAATVAKSPSPGQLQPVSATRRLVKVWTEEAVLINSEFSLSNDYNQLRFDSFNVMAESLSANGKGQIDDLAGEMVVDFDGTWNPDWQVLNQVFQEYAGDLAAFSGSRPQRLTVKGPLFSNNPPPESADAWIPPQLEIRSGIGWDQASLLKLPVGASQIDVELVRSIATINVDQLPLSGGTLNLAPKLDLSGTAPTLRLDNGLTLNNLSLTPETCHQFLKYVAPLAADATSAEGTFSLSAQQIVIPLMEPARSTAQGVVRLEQITIGAGPLAKQLLSLADQMKRLLKPGGNSRDLSTWIQFEKQTIPFALHEGRIYHRDLTIRYKDITIKTNGSVGLDQTIKVTAEIAIHDDWIAGKKLLAGLKGKSLSIPVTGTLSLPRIDARALHNLSKQLAKQTATSAFNNTIGELLGTPGAGKGGIGNESNQNELKDASKALQNKLEGELLKGFDKLFKK